MRAVTAVFVSAVALAAMSIQAAPLAPRQPGPVIYLANQVWAPLPGPQSQASVDTAPPIDLVAQGCG
jgi:hypothetical protein